MAEVLLGEYEVAEDMLVDGLKIVQDTRLYRFTSDSVLLSRFATPKKNDVIADFCAGSGIVGFHFFALHKARFAQTPFTLFELQAPLLKLAEKTALLNGFTNFRFENLPLQQIPTEYNERFSLILCNPPYERGGLENDCYEKAVCRKELTLTLEEVAKAASRALKFGGRLDMVHRADRLAEICYTLKKYNLEVKKLQFVAGTPTATPYLVLLEAVKGGKPATALLPTLVN